MVRHWVTAYRRGLAPIIAVLALLPAAIGEAPEERPIEPRGVWLPPRGPGSEEGSYAYGEAVHLYVRVEVVANGVAQLRMEGAVQRIGHESTFPLVADQVRSADGEYPTRTEVILMVRWVAGTMSDEDVESVNEWRERHTTGHPPPPSDAPLGEFRVGLHVTALDADGRRLETADGSAAPQAVFHQDLHVSPYEPSGKRHETPVSPSLAILAWLLALVVRAPADSAGYGPPPSRRLWPKRRP